MDEECLAASLEVKPCHVPVEKERQHRRDSKYVQSVFASLYRILISDE